LIGKHSWLRKRDIDCRRVFAVKTTEKNIQHLNGLLISGFARELIKKTDKYNKHFHKYKSTTDDLTYGVGVALTQFENHLNISRPTAIKLKQEAIDSGFISTKKKYLSQDQLRERGWDIYPSEVSKRDSLKLIDLLIQDGLSSYFEFKKHKSKFKLFFRDIDEFHFSEFFSSVNEFVKP
jgi:hypothetical protein